MPSSLRLAALTAALTCGIASGSSAQELATYGSVEGAGLGEGSALIGATWSAGTRGWGPIAALIAQSYRYRDGVGSHSQAAAISPSLGLQYRMTDGAVQGAVGYTFVSAALPAGTVVGDAGGKNGVFATLQGNYWGTGENSAQYIGAYNFASEYYWTRVRAAHRLTPEVYVGGEVVAQGTQATTPSAMRYEVGPTIEYRLSPEFRVGASGGYRGGNNGWPGTGYARIEFLLLTKL